MTWYIVIAVAISILSLFIATIIKLAYFDGQKDTEITAQKEVIIDEKTYLDDAAKPALDADELLNKLRDDAGSRKL